MSSPPRLATTRGMAVATTVDSMAARKIDSITPSSARRLARSSISGRPCRRRSGRAARSSVYGSTLSCVSAHTTRRLSSLLLDFLRARWPASAGVATSAQAPQGQARRRCSNG